MKDLFILMRSLLMGFEGVKWVDKDKGQIDRYGPNGPEVAFPCALTKIEVIKRENRGGGIQHCTARVTVRFAFEENGSTSNAASETAFQRSLKFYDFETALYKMLQGFDNQNFEDFECRSTVEETRPDNYWVLSSVFETEYDDIRAAQ